MKNIVFGVVAAVMMSTAAMADTLTLQYPSNPGKGGTAFWGDTVMAQLNKKLKKYGHEIVPRYYSGQRGKKSLKEYATNGVNDPTMMVLANGGNGEAFLLEDVGGFDYRDYDPVVIMNTDIWVSINSDADFKNDIMKFPSTGGTGFAADITALGLMMCGPEANANVDTFIACTEERLRFIPGFTKGGQRRQAFNVGQLDVTRDTPQSSMMAYGDRFASGEARVWFAHGIVNGKGGVDPDPNAPEGAQSFDEVYEAEWGEAPSGPVYEGYRAFQAYRDGFQKTIWTQKNSPYKADLDAAVADMLNDPEVIAIFNEKLGEFPWLGGAEVQAHSDYIFSLVTKERLETLVYLAHNVFNYKDAYVKTELLD